MGKKSRRKRESKRDGLSSSRSDDTNVQRTASIERPLPQGRVLFIFVSLFLILANLVVYWQVRNHDFLNYDDNTYVTENPYVQEGLTWEGLVWAFTTTYANFWHPLTWLSYMLDYQIYGLKPGGYHLTNLLFHVANTLLLLIVLKRMTGALWRSAFVSALFALHPLHVESVAWVSQRKDVLSTFFWILTMGSYVLYVECPRLGRYLLVLLSFTLGLMAKPMLVTLPFVLLLLDYWPFDRFQLEQANNFTGYLANGQQRSAALRLVWEKIPFLVIAGAASIVAFLAQQSGGAITPLDKLPVSLRITNALVSYASYIGKMIWPHHLAVPYLYPETVPFWKAAAAGLFLLAVSAMVVRGAQRHPYLIVGWLWYLGTLVPVSGLVQVGSHAMADRYTYVPLLGLFIVIAWGAFDLTARWRFRKPVLAILTAVLLLTFTACTWLQVALWKDSITLFEHAVNVTSNNGMAHYNLGVALEGAGRLDEAITHYSRALQIKPDHTETRNNLANVLYEQGRIQEAMDHYSGALEIRPDDAGVHNNIGIALAREGKLDEAIGHYNEALRIDPDYAGAHHNLANALAREGKLDKAISHYNEALQIDPDQASTHRNLANALSEQARLQEAIDHYSKALQLDPSDASVHNNIGVALARQGKLKEAVGHFSAVLQLKPDDVEALTNLGLALAKHGRFDEGFQHLSRALQIKPDYAKAHSYMGIALAGQGRLDEAIEHFSGALRITPDDAVARQNLERALRLSGKSNMERGTSGGR